MSRFLPVALLLALCSGSCITFKPHSESPSSEAKVVEGVPIRKFGFERCAAGSLSVVLNSLGDPVSLEELDGALPKARNGGVLSLDVLLEARARGFEAHLVEGSPDLITAALQRGRPVILMLRVLNAPGVQGDLFHYVVVDGFDPGRDLVRIQYGDGKARWTSLTRVDKAWEAAGRATLLVAPGGAVMPEAEDEVRYAVALETLGREDEAAALYRRLLEEDPANALLWTNLGNAEAAQGRRTEAEHAYRQALILDPHNRDALNNLAWLLLEEGQRLGEAEELATRAVEAAGPDHHLVLDTLGRVLLARGRCGEAIEVFTQAIATALPESPERPRLHLGLGISQSECGQVEEAQKSLERTLSEGADEQVRRAAESALEALARFPR